MEIKVKGCYTCPLSTELFDHCNHPEATKEMIFEMTGLTDYQLEKKNARPKKCPLKIDILVLK